METNKPKNDGKVDINKELRSEIPAELRKPRDPSDANKPYYGALKGPTPQAKKNPSKKKG